MRVLAFAGEPGAFAEAAARAHDAGAATLPCADAAAAAAAVVGGRAGAAVLPVWNTVAGEIAGTRVAAAGLVEVARVELPIVMALVGVAGADAGGVRRVLSHPAALTQCAGLIARLGAAADARASTSHAMAEVARLGDPAVAALGLAAGAGAHGLGVLADDVGDRADAVTRFGVFARG